MAIEIEKYDDTKLSYLCPAPGRPGNKPCWETGAKEAVGTAITRESRVWFTIAHGFLNEIYFPDVDRANTRFLRFLVAGDNGYLCDECNGVNYSIKAFSPGIPLYRISSECKDGRFSLEKEILTDPERDALLIKSSFKPANSANNLRLYIFCNSHVRDEGQENDGWLGRYKSDYMLFAQRDGLCFAIACSSPWKATSCGYMGVSDGLTDLRANGGLMHRYNIAEKGNIALTGEIDLAATHGRFTLALGCGGTSAEAAQQARAALLRDFDQVRKQYVSGWRDFHSTVTELSRSDDNDLFRVSAAISRVHESKRFPGAFVASLSIPWGFDRSDNDLGGYHVIWPRDLCETALGLLACGDADSARRALFYLETTQGEDGNWPQNMWLDGSKNWTSKQMDETAFPILLADALRRSGQLEGHNPWPLLKKTASYLVKHGPVAEQDRWEQDPGYATFTMSVEIAAVLAAADFADLNEEHEQARFLRETADAWNEAVDELTYAHDTDLARRCGVAGYYLRLTPPDAIRAASLDELTIKLTNHAEGDKIHRAVDIVSPDALALVRFGLRAADDPRILDTVKVIDENLLTMTATGPAWRRYSDDGYGEHPDGRPYKKTGVGRCWPLMAGERAHYELAKGDIAAAEELRRTMARQTSECGLIPEQVWDAADIPEHGLFNGHPTGSGMPLVWAHAEYIQLLRSLREGAVWSTPPQPVERYVKGQTQASFQIWTCDQQRARITPGKELRIDLHDPATIEWTVDGWKSTQHTTTADSGLGVHYALLRVSQLLPGAEIRFRVAQEEHSVKVIRSSANVAVESRYSPVVADSVFESTSQTNTK